MTGGFRYRGTVIGVEGQIFYGDLWSREVWGSTFSGSAWSQPGAAFQPVLPAALTAFGEDEAGDLTAIAGSTGYGGSVDGDLGARRPARAARRAVRQRLRIGQDRPCALLGTAVGLATIGA